MGRGASFAKASVSVLLKSVYDALHATKLRKPDASLTKLLVQFFVVPRDRFRNGSAQKLVQGLPHLLRVKRNGLSFTLRNAKLNVVKFLQILIHCPNVRLRSCHNNPPKAKKLDI